MLAYLDNASRRRRTRPTRTTRRELLELHTVGVGGGYSESDGRVARRWLLTGHVDRRRSPTTYLYRHDPGTRPGAVKVLGFSHPNASAVRREGRRRGYLPLPGPPPGHRPADRPKLAVRFVSRRPAGGTGRTGWPKVYLAKNTEIAAGAARRCSRSARVRGLGRRRR